MNDTTTHITLGVVFSWIFGVLFLIAGLAAVFSKPLSGILLLLAALVALPPINAAVKKHYNVA